MTDSTGSLSAIGTYDEYGLTNNTLSSDLPTYGRFRYTGQTYIPELGMYYYKARMYSPTLGRFMQTDPIGYGDGMNMYGYVGGDPVNRVDPSGLCGAAATATGYSEELAAQCSAEAAAMGMNSGMIRDLSGELMRSMHLASVESQIASSVMWGAQPLLREIAEFHAANAAEKSWGEALQDWLDGMLGNEQDPLGPEPRPITSADIGPTTGGVVIMSGEMWREGDTLGIHINYIEARGFGRNPMINQSVDTMVATARNHGLNRIDISGVMGSNASAQFFRGLTTLPYQVGIVEAGPYTFVSITGF